MKFGCFIVFVAVIFVFSSPAHSKGEQFRATMPLLLNLGETIPIIDEK